MEEKNVLGEKKGRNASFRGICKSGVKKSEEGEGAKAEQRNVCNAARGTKFGGIFLKWNQMKAGRRKGNMEKEGGGYPAERREREEENQQNETRKIEHELTS